ncbi:FAD binding domain-containing protein [Coprinopsis marcescibilis]|uniref:FAD binding domain-containing protein n=1 Tax=Coprinopsis marcescibilis TaxID=230819 RepID=A0A5C3KT41_COPMA|nr:FAD binding domain-containing protein [Coprinopsis marcescibilis]
MSLVCRPHSFFLSLFLMPVSSIPPESTSVLIIGGGPAGAYAASALAREGIEVTLLEASKFPRYHIGESLIPSVRHYLRFIGAEEKLANQGFIRKPGSAIKFNQFKREGYTDFISLGHQNNAWNVVRSEFDLMLLNHARSCGVAVYEQTRVDGVEFSTIDPNRPVSVSWTHTPPPRPISPPASPIGSTFSRFIPRTFSSTEPCRKGEPAQLQGKTSFTHVIDATGRAGLLSTRYLKNRHFNASLKNIALWGYWSGVGKYGENTDREGAPWFEALTDESGWAWFIPLHNGTTSVGVVMHEKLFNAKVGEINSPSPTPASANTARSESTIVARYISCLSLAPGVVDLITQSGILNEGSVKSSSDFSYSANSYAGPGYRVVGDAGAFIDPFFSSGVHLAMTSALSAAATICASLRSHCTEAEAALWHTRRVSTSYTRFQIVVLSAYKQIRSQAEGILSDIDEDNYDRAFSVLRPVIQGASDMGARLSETELQKSLDFCVNLFNPTSPEQHRRVAEKNNISEELLSVTGPLLDPTVLENSLKSLTHSQRSKTIRPPEDDSGDDSDTERVAETKMVLDKINARRVLHSEYYINNLEVEPLEGLVMILDRSRLGLRKT